MHQQPWQWPFLHLRVYVDLLCCYRILHAPCWNSPSSNPYTRQWVRPFAGRMLYYGVRCGHDAFGGRFGWGFDYHICGHRLVQKTWSYEVLTNSKGPGWVPLWVQKILHQHGWYPRVPNHLGCLQQLLSLSIIFIKWKFPEHLKSASLIGGHLCR